MTDTAPIPTNNRQVKSKKRVADFGEVFTAEREVNAMLDLLPNAIWQAGNKEAIGKTFLEPACGNGNFLAEILSRKLSLVLKLVKIKKKGQKSYTYSKSDYERNAIYAISSIYGIEILSDNCIECRKRLLDIFTEHYQSHFKDIDDEIIRIAEFLLNKNIINGNALTLKDLNENPIVFSEWKFTSHILVQRRDYVYENLVEKLDNASPIDKGFIAKPIPPDYTETDFKKLREQKNEI
ncbi:restriction endonuclease subunit M [Moraxella bovis]|uniref:Restriction endonuclease subunit M n=1 Tax=Moraxella bovis TaxID=476 RepID=A0AAQ2Q416_MORBO|nr:restriction endonuclease subunit M [Moraxella bovis]OOR88684.1 restriction endonuclease subunit M [Moraxella bovis]UYZ75911.1 restriction endonuclease subunit M [Moraxella bovis]UYZ78148.1 restriction endonuclease subunit M [Moraxella bovis]UYZ81031.1 restriction endonuclease subunit M [Moraxella bovis]UYZ86631.1 restriction endonuclease subunit M [Moraxella bovis]